MAKTVEIDNNSINTITAGTVIRGNITTPGDFRMDGMLEGNMASNGTLFGFQIVLFKEFSISFYVLFVVESLVVLYRYCE